MKCPKCELEMQKGFLPVVKSRLYWAPEEERVEKEKENSLPEDMYEKNLITGKKVS